VPQDPVSGVATLDIGLTGDDIIDWELYVDGSLAGTYEEIPTEWDARGIADGEHELLVAAYAEDGSVWISDPLTVTVSNTVEEPS
jgi:hypothetical protein